MGVAWDTSQLGLLQPIALVIRLFPPVRRLPIFLGSASARHPGLTSTSSRKHNTRLYLRSLRKEFMKGGLVSAWASLMVRHSSFYHKQLHPDVLAAIVHLVEECDHEEVYRVFEKCAEHDTVLFIHHRGEMHDLSDSHELIADCAATGAKLQVC